MRGDIQAVGSEEHESLAFSWTVASGGGNAAAFSSEKSKYICTVSFSLSVSAVIQVAIITSLNPSSMPKGKTHTSPRILNIQSNAPWQSNDYLA